tara:strand:- start:1326 stop:1613 length:288 start_codon:yes stop_codon:yes gene_type:complete
MIDENDLSKKKARGDKAKSLFQNEIFNEVFSILEKRYIEGFAESKADDNKLREDCYFLLQNLRRFRQEIVLIIEDGELSTQRLEQLNNPKKRKFF